MTTEYDASKYGKSVGDEYDTLYPGDGLDTEATILMLADLTNERHPRSLLEFGIGTGRIALGLVAKDIHVSGLDGSESMVAQLHDKPGAERIEVAIGDYRSTRTGDKHSVVLLAFNGILDPRGRQAQRDIFKNAAAHLVPAGLFVVESFVLSDAQRSGDWSIAPRYVGENHVELQLMRFNISDSRVERTLVHLRPEGPKFVSVFDTYASPGELDLLGETAGFSLRCRYADWTGSEFTSTSSRHVSIYALDHPG